MPARDRIVTFLQDVCSRFEKFCLLFNFPDVLEKKTFDSKLGPLEMHTSRGNVFEKASLIYCDLKIETPPVLAGQFGQKGSTAEALVVEMNLFPVNPRVPKGYLELRANITDTVAFAGGTDIFPYFKNEEDNEFFAEGIEALCKRHELDYAAMRQARVDFFQSKYRKGTVGSHAGIYSFHLEEKNFTFITELADMFLALYGALVDKRNAEEFTEHDIEKKLKIHGQWAEWILLEDSGTKFGLDQGIPPEALLSAILPPKAIF